MEVHVVLEHNPETGVWLAEALGVPGGYTQGATRDEALENIREVLRLLRSTQELMTPPHVELARVSVEA